MKVLVAPLNWGLGHATRCVPLIERFVSCGHEVVVGSDGQALNYLISYFPQLRHVDLAPLNLHYSKRKSQVLTLLRQLPHFLHWLADDRKRMSHLQEIEHFDIIVSDNRFNLAGATYCIYITHQLHIMFPPLLRWAEPIAQWWHRQVAERYDECWVPDYEKGDGLAGELSHPKQLPQNVRYIGPLSRFSFTQQQTTTENYVLAIISGLEPQRSIFEKWVRDNHTQAKIINGQPPYPSDTEIANLIMGAKQIICRSGYSSIMDFEALKVLNKVIFVPTPGQTEQEYLAQKLKSDK